MKLNASEFLLSKKKDLQQIVKNLQKDFKYVSVLGTDVTGKDFSVQTSGIHVSPSENEERGFVIRVFSETGFSEYSFTDIASVEKVCAKVRETVESDRKAFAAIAGNIEYPTPPHDEALKIDYVGDVAVLPQEVSPQDVISLLSSIHDKVKAKYDKVVQLYLNYSYTQVNKIFVSESKDLYQSYLYSNSYAVATARDGDNIQDDYLSVSGLCGYELTDQIEKIANEATARATELLYCEKVEPGEYDIICDPDFTGLIAHEAFGHGAEMDMFVKNRAKGMEYVGRRVASDKVVMHDGAAAYDEVSSYKFDDEGNVAQDTVIIDHGILKNGMCDELSALLLNTSPTGNGKRESYKRKAYTRMTNTFFEDGTDSLEDMIASIDNGYLLEGLASGMEDPKNWGIQCVATKGREIKDGKLTGKVVSPVYLTGYVPELLESVTMVSPGIVMSGSGYCGKGWKEWVKTSTGGSYIKARGKLS